MALEPGSRLGHYNVTSLIGQGGMGEVYQARDTKLDRDVALKVLPEAFTSDPDRLARFEREAKVLASLNQPNIGSIYGLEEAGGVKALVLELVEGPTLADRIAQGPILIDEALPIAKQIAEALEAAHEQDVIHRDLKPANIKVREDGTVKVLDFGLAKALAGDVQGQDLSQSPTVTASVGGTREGVILGTAAYMSPEQARGKPLDKRTDIWSFGCVLYETLAGRVAFRGETLSDTIGKILERAPDFGLLPPDTPAVVEKLITRCLDKNPKKRVRDIGDVLLVMEGAFETTLSAPAQPAVEPPTLQVWQRPMPMAVVGVALALLGGLTVWGVMRPVPPPVSRFTIAADRLAAQGVLPTVQLSPDGRTLVYTRLEGGLQLFQRPLDTLEALPIRGTAGGSAAFFSPDGEWVGFYKHQEQVLQKVSLAGGPPTTLTPVPGDSGSDYGFASWGPDGTIVFAAIGGLWRVADTGGAAQQIASVEAPVRYVTPEFLPNGDAVLFTNLLTSKWVEVSEPAQLARCLQPICHRVTTID